MSVSQSYVSGMFGVPSSKKSPARRSELEIRMDVLQVVSQGIDRPTQIMYKANLSWIALQGNIKALVGRGFLTEENLGTRRRYELTQTGTEILRDYMKVVEAMGSSQPVQKRVEY